MPSEIRVNKDVGVIEVRSYGDVSIDDLRGQILDTKRIAAEAGIRKVLVDAADEKSLPAAIDILDFMSTLPRDLAYATYSRPGQITIEDMKFAETVALNRGIRLRHFVDRDTALEWLLGQSVTQPSLNTSDSGDGK